MPDLEDEPPVEWGDLTPLAVKALRLLLDNPDPEIRLKAARTVLELKVELLARL